VAVAGVGLCCGSGSARDPCHVVVAVVVRACVVRDAGEDGEEGARCIKASGGLKRVRVVHGVAGLVSVNVCVFVF
jgi:hypothetical protein